jgi:hypothetical protein
LANCEELEDVTIVGPVETIGANAFAYCQKLSGIELPETLREIGESAFFHCNNLESITLPASITRIGNGAFYNTGISEIIIERDPDFLGTSDKEVLAQLSRFVGYGKGDAVPRDRTCTVVFNCEHKGDKMEKRFEYNYTTGEWKCFRWRRVFLESYRSSH